MKGLGNDLIELDRIRKVLDKHPERFIERLLTLKEQEYCASFQDSVPHIAGRFAAKEAIAKALGTGFGEYLGMTDMWILNDKMGKPEVFFSDQVMESFKQPKVLISISHSKDYASAVAVWL
ncbi:Holo-[acyl-carrier-protein] synthase [Chlamydiales bacterium SCGC AG-110-M15]|nr:Holo-[acyl-carrier-protein] synthase [Chlamydiales bacterium SCGC AG-110-M15]